MALGVEQAKWSWRLPLDLLLGRARSTRPQPARVHSSAVVQCAVYRDGRKRSHSDDYAVAYAQAARTRGGFVWLGLHEPTFAEMADVARVFGLHELAVDDALSADQRAKVSRYGDITFVVLRTTGYVDHHELTETSEVVQTGVIMMFVGPKFVITVRHGAPGALRAVRAALEQRPPRLAQGPWAVAHAVCDEVVKSYLDVAGLIEADLETLEEMVFARRARGGIAHVHQLKRELIEFKRAVVPLQRPLAQLADDSAVAPAQRAYLRDVSDTLSRVVDRVGNLDDLLTSILQARLAQIAVDQNNDMRKIASWGAIAASQTAIAGVYGMNFDSLPGLHSAYGLPIVFGVMLTTGVALYRSFRRSGWL
ncbi:MAG: magnesium and cobalt transport protein CorA [Hamadaea sp.]|nr:magnesium and cobalt transport protein CorA [Hamadaea sp.]